MYVYIAYGYMYIHTYIRRYSSIFLLGTPYTEYNTSLFYNTCTALQSCFLPTVPAPENVILSHDRSFTSVYAGAPLTISCLIEISINVDTAILATIDWLPSYIYTDSRITITNTTQFFTTALYTASVSFNPVLYRDISNFTCSGTFESSIEVLNVLGSGIGRNSIELAVEGEVQSPCSLLRYQ